MPVIARVEDLVPLALGLFNGGYVDSGNSFSSRRAVHVYSTCVLCRVRRYQAQSGSHVPGMSRPLFSCSSPLFRFYFFPLPLAYRGALTSPLWGRGPLSPASGGNSSYSSIFIHPFPGDSCYPALPYGVSFCPQLPLSPLLPLPPVRHCTDCQVLCTSCATKLVPASPRSSAPVLLVPLPVPFNPRRVPLLARTVL